MTELSTDNVQSGQPAARAAGKLVLCIAAGSAPLFLKATGLLALVATTHVEITVSPPGLLVLLVPFLLLAVWRVAPDRVWPWLLLIGALTAVPWVLVREVPGLYEGPFGQTLAVISGCSPAFTLVGVLGAGTWLWQTGSRAPAAAIIGSAPVLQLLGPVVLLSTVLHATWLFQTLGIVLIVVALAGSVGVLVLRRPDGATTAPPWSLILAGGVLAGVNVLTILWQPTPPADAEALADPFGDYYLLVGLTFLVIGLVAAAFFGMQVLLSSLAIGLLIGAFSMLVQPSTEQLDQIPEIAVLAALVSIGLGVAAVLSRWRVQLGTAGLAVVIVVLFSMYVLFNRDDPVDQDHPYLMVATPLLVPISVVAAMTLIASLGVLRADRGETPPILVGLTMPFALAAMSIVAHFGVHEPEDRAPIVGVLPPVMVCLVIAMVVFGATVGARSRAD